MKRYKMATNRKRHIEVGDYLCPVCEKKRRIILPRLRKIDESKKDYFCSECLTAFELNSRKKQWFQLVINKEGVVVRKERVDVKEEERQ